MKAGGHGAPLAPYFHEYISVKEKPFVNILNLGGFQIGHSSQIINL
jgi:1,6-anhydro-N-acetylmuramate kinase